jgi:type IV pilus assembly protein PilV
MTTMRQPKPQSGVMLIEALIAILIFSIGILALVGMQGTAIKNTADARFRSEAAFLANQILSQMWLDRTNLSRYGDADGTNYAARTAWRTKVEGSLPGVNIVGNSRVPSIRVLNPGVDDEVTVIIYWMQPGKTLDPSCSTAGNETTPACTNRFQIINRIKGGVSP